MRAAVECTMKNPALSELVRYDIVFATILMKSRRPTATWAKGAGDCVRNGESCPTRRSSGALWSVDRSDHFMKL